MTSSVNSVVAGVPAQVGRAHALRDRLEARLADRARRPAAPSSSPCASSAAPARIIAIGFATFFPCSDGAVPCAASAMSASGSKSSSNATSSDSEPAIEPKSGSTRSERMSPSRFSAGMTSGSPVERDQQRERRVDQLRLVRDVRVARGRGVHLLLEHPLVDRADGVLRAAEDLRAGALGLAERELGDRVADAALDPLRAERDLVVALALAPFLRAVRVADGHAHDRDRRVHAAERDDARNAPPGPDDHLAADLLAQDPVRRADVAARPRA